MSTQQGPFFSSYNFIQYWQEFIPNISTISENNFSLEWRSIVIVWSSLKKKFHQWCFEARTQRAVTQFVGRFSAAPTIMITYIICGPALSFTVFDGWCYPFIKNKMNQLSDPLQNFLPEIFCYATKISWEILVKMKCCINDLNISFIWGCIAFFVLRYVKSADFDVCIIIPSTCFKDKGTGAKG